MNSHPAPSTRHPKPLSTANRPPSTDSASQTRDSGLKTQVSGFKSPPSRVASKSDEGGTLNFEPLPTENRPPSTNSGLRFPVSTAPCPLSTLHSSPSALSVSNLHYRYPDGRAALRGVSFTIGEGECVGLIGPNGAGKSTLLLHLNGILPERIGGEPAVFVGGVPVSTENLSAIRRQVGFLFQDADDQLFCPTVFEDVAFGPQQFGLDEAKVHAALATVGLAGYEERSPQHLSRGEKRRVCLAGVLACDPQVLVLDEPTSDLDPRGKRELKVLLRQIPATKLIASHDLELVVELCPRSLVLDGGVVVADGPTRELLNDTALMLKHGLERPHILQHWHPH